MWNILLQFGLDLCCCSVYHIQYSISCHLSMGLKKQLLFKKPQIEKQLMPKEQVLAPARKTFSPSSNSPCTKSHRIISILISIITT